MFLQTVHSAEPTKTNWATHRLNGRLASATPLVKQKTGGIREVGVAVGAVIGSGRVHGRICHPQSFASIPGQVSSKGAAGGKRVATSGACGPLLLLHWT